MSAIWVCLFYCSPGVVCVIRKRVSFEDSLLQNITVTFDPAAFVGFTGFFDLFSHSARVDLKLIDTYFNNKSKMKSRCNIWHKNILLVWGHMP